MIQKVLNIGDGISRNNKLSCDLIVYTIIPTFHGASKKYPIDYTYYLINAATKTITKHSQKEVEVKLESRVWIRGRAIN